VKRTTSVMGRTVTGIQRIRRTGEIYQDQTRQPLPQGRTGHRRYNGRRSKNTYFSAKYRPIASRRGPMRALVAVEHVMAIAAFNMLTNGDSYRDPGPDYYTARQPARTRARAISQLVNLGYRVTWEPLANTA
jgi:transposase